MDLAELLDPASTAVVTSELQRGVVGDEALFPALAAAARERGVVAAAARLCEAARDAGVTVIHGCASRRPDGLGANANAPLFTAAARAEPTLAPGSAAAAVVDVLGDTGTDLVLTRLHGLNPMARTELDPILRNLGVRTLVVAGVSVNVAITNLVMDAVNAGYQVVLPRDGVAGTPTEYADAVVEHTLSILATVTDVAAIARTWRLGASGQVSSDDPSERH